MSAHIYRGLEGVAFAKTALSEVDGAAGRVTIRGYDLRDLAGKVTFDDIVGLLFQGDLPTPSGRDALAASIREAVTLPFAASAALSRAVAADPMDALRAAAAALPSPSETNAATAISLIGGVAGMITDHHRLRLSEITPPEAPEERSTAAFLLHGVLGRTPTIAQTRALDAYLVTMSEHGMNASTFVARCVISTDSDMVSALTAAIASLKGPRHGGVPGPLLHDLLAIGETSRIEPWVRAQVAQKKRILGFGHRVYKVRDPRAEVLAEAAGELAQTDKEKALLQFVQDFDAITSAVLAEIKPTHKLFVNVELYAALILHLLGIPADLFTPLFAAGRTAGWCAHMIEQHGDNRLIHPEVSYVGARGREI
ncbi:citrate synthase/methylcitrate synthase [Capsulimonas corticalis]|uniref:Citrate synthase n=1 Tax=Capsulimonas corticalis TaxID=2219043 RepID=A0A402CSB3_9BACT|nr:citrate/2-methylcitrate synthase [Capsulimonas corticalis]BDI28323.1 citrate synthase/methylcitrate synthase [Capsulimonas corticalis]